jgi:NAD(P)-dependent dehydrogenase (short-subunit alcohol dehydrogenase family)
MRSRRAHARPARWRAAGPGEIDMEKVAAGAGDPAPGQPRSSAVSFLTSDDAAFITGQTLHVNGGLVRG